MPRGFLYLIGAVIIGLVVVGAAKFSARSSTCMVCHRQEASFAIWMSNKLKAEKRGFSHELISCADCHMTGSPAKTAMSRLRSLLHAVTYLVTQIDPRRQQISGLFNRTRVPSENCQYCHYASVYRKAVFLKDLPPELKKIGLTMDHRKHVLAKENTCAQCHERFKRTDDSVVDKTVNYAEVNHLACDSCHSFASHYYRSGRLLPMPDQEFFEARNEAWDRLSTNPRWMVAIPAEKTCKRCHNGKIHYKAKIFESDCRTGSHFENCLKCHPIMTQEYFDNYRKEQSAAGVESGFSRDFTFRKEPEQYRLSGKTFTEKRGGIGETAPLESRVR